MKKLIKGLLASVLLAVGLSTTALADNVLVIDGQYNSATTNVVSRLQAAGHTVTSTTDVSQVPTGTGTYQQVWDLRYSAALSNTEVTNYTSFITAGGFAYFVTENPGCCMTRNNSIAALVTGLGGGSTQIGPGWASNVETNLNTTYMTQGITVNYLAVAAIVNSSGIPLISDAQGNVSGMSWIGRAGALASGVTGTIVTVADVNWLSEAWGTQNQQALDDIITGIVAGTVGGTISAQGNGAAASNGAAQQQNNAPTTFDHTDANQVVASDTMSSGTFTGNGGALQAVSGSATISNDIALTANGMILDSNGQSVSLTGAISGPGGLVFTNTGTGGSTTLNGTYTYTGPTTINNSATVINNSNISSSSSVTNLGNFTNNGTAGNWVNGFNGNGNTAVLNNAGTLGNGTNYSTFNNTGTVGNIVNVGTTNNTGTGGAVQNVGVFNNNAGGTISELAYNNYVVRNHGTINSITYQGGSFTNYTDGTVGSINTTQAHGNFNNQGTITGNVTTNSNNFTNQATGVVQGTYTNSGTLRNYGSIGTVVNNNTLTNYSTGTIGNLTNTGTFTTGSVTLGTYTQSSTGSTSLPYGSVITTTGAASIDGGLTMTGAPYTTGKYNVLTGSPVTGTFSSYNGVGVLRYTPTGVQIWVMPDGTVVQAQVDRVAGNMNTMNSLATGSAVGSLGSDCGSFGDEGGCISVNYGTSKVGTGDLNSTGITVSKSIDANWRVGVFGSQQLNNPSIGNIKYTSNTPAVGALIGWNESADGVGLGATLSAVQGTGDYTIGSDKTGVSTKAVQAKFSYSKPISLDTTVTPYVGVRHSEFKVNGYTENGAIFPLTYSGVTQTATDLLAGVTVSQRLDEGLTGTISAGVVQNIGYKAGSVSATSDMGNFNKALSGGNYTSAALGAGLSYEVAKNQKINFNAGWQQKSLTNANITSYGIGYTVGF